MDPSLNPCQVSDMLCITWASLKESMSSMDTGADLLCVLSLTARVLHEAICKAHVDRMDGVAHHAFLSYDQA